MAEGHAHIHRQDKSLLEQPPRIKTILHIKPRANPSLAFGRWQVLFLCKRTRIHLSSKITFVKEFAVK